MSEPVKYKCKCCNAIFTATIWIGEERVECTYPVCPHCGNPILEIIEKVTK